MKKGDLVKFYSTFWGFQRDYRSKNPGIVLGVMKVKNSTVTGPRGSATVRWSDGSITTEHDSYLKILNQKR